MNKDEIRKFPQCTYYCPDCKYFNFKDKHCEQPTLITEQENEIDRLKAENEELAKVVSGKVYDFIDDVKGIADAREAWERQAKIDVLNELKKKTHNYYPSIDSYCVSQHVVLVRDVDELIKEVQNGKIY